jgi:acyl transferase domain-containing protein/NAD(P)-dependent dehydrogenase (short-subunit alcohol dehydrogenase family)
LNSKPEPLAIIGIGCLFPKAAGPGFYWANVKKGVDCIGEVPPTHWDPADYFDEDPKRADMTYARRGGFLEPVEFNPLEFGIAPRDIEATDTTQLLGLVAAKQALVDAGVVFSDGPGDNGRRPVDRDRVSVILGVTGTLELVIPLGARLGHPKWKRAMKAAGIDDDQIEDAAGRIAESYVPWQENSFPGLLGNVVAGRIANRLDLGGTNCVVDAACASSLSAVHLAALELQAGRADVVVTGGCDTFNDIFMYMCFSKTPALSPTGNAKPFDADGDGTILGEGLGIVVLKRLADAERAGDTVYAVIKGIGSSSDGKGNAIYAPSADGQEKCLRTTYDLAGVTPDTIELVEAHGTGTRVGDATEATALTEVFREGSKARPWCAIGSVKSQIGHTKAAAGAASLIKSALALYYKVLPPTIKVTKPVDPLGSADSPFYVNLRMRPWLPRADHPRRAAVSAFGFGGSNFHAVLEEHKPEKNAVDWDGSVEIAALGASTIAELAADLSKVPTEWPAFARFAEESRASFDHLAKCRLILTAHRVLTDLPKLLAGARTKLAAEPDAAAWHTRDGAHFGTGPARGTLGVLFPGQGSQTVGMLRELVCLFPEMLDSLALANRAAAALSQDSSDAARLSDRIYPPATFDVERKKFHDDDLRRTHNAQPALGAVNYGSWRVLADRFGVKADAFAGHSYGELVALAAAGRLSSIELFTLSRLRGRLMGEQRVGDAGAMLAVLAPVTEIERLIGDRTLDLVLANHNAPNQAVLSGSTKEIDRAAEAFASAGMKCSRLPVAAAFHSRFVADAAIPFRAALESVKFGPGAVPVFANTTAAEYPDDPTAARDLLANQLAQPVAFVNEICAMADRGVRTFLEVGPGSVLTRLTESILATTDHPDCEVISLDASGGTRSGVLDLANVLARLLARGHWVKLAEWEAGSRCRPTPVRNGKPGLTIALTGANYVAPREPRPPVSRNGKHDISNGSPAIRARPSAAPSVHGPVDVARPRPAIVKAAAMTDADPNTIAQALAVTQQSLAALQRMQEQTAALHKQFLESQESAQRTLHALVEQQQSLLISSLGARASLAELPSLPDLPQSLQARAAQVPPRPVHSLSDSPIAPPAPPSSVPVPISNGRQGRENIATMLLAVVSEKTGYPADSLDLGLSLDADLGVDSIKRVEILSALQEKLPSAPVVKPEHLGSLHTLRDVADFLAGPAPATDSPAAESSAIPNSTFADAATAPQIDVVTTILLDVIAEKTGYPAASLDAAMSLDSDLGVDSIKRVEILAAVKEKLPGAPEVKAEHLGSLHTIRDVAEHLAAAIPGSVPTTARLPIFQITPPPTTRADQTPNTAPTPVVVFSPETESDQPDTEHVSKIQQQMAFDGAGGKVGRPGSDVSRPPGQRTGGENTLRAPGPLAADRVDRSILQAGDLDLGHPRPRVALPRGSTIWIVSEPDPLAEAIVDLLAGHGYGAKILPWSDSSTAKPPESLAGLVLLAPSTTGHDFRLNRKAFGWLKKAASRLRQTGRSSGATLATISRMDGAFGLANLSADVDPTQGGLAGLVKTARHEWPEVACKAIDLDPTFSAVPIAAAAVLDELLCVGPAEVGIARTHRCTLELARTVRRQGPQLISLGTKDVILVTGGARGVTAETAVALAETYSPTLILTGRTPPPGTEPDWLAGLTTEADIKKVLTAKLGPTAGPRRVGEQYHLLIAQREIRRTLDRLTATGARVAYFPVNITDAKAVDDLLRQVRTKFGPISAIVHGAGVLADKRIEDLSPDQFDQVYTTKVDGLQNVLNGLGEDDLKALILFSSTTARYGRIGQAAYACANEALNKTAQIEARRRPGCRVVSINWGPWDGGMVTPALRKVFESEGVGLIPLLDGAVFLIQELNAAGKAVEVIAMPRPRGGSGAIAMPMGLASSTPPPAGSAATGSGVVANPHPAELSLAFERSVDIASHPILKAHVLDGRAVLPLALHLEWLAHAALHGHPGLVFHGFNDLRVTHGVQVDPGAAIPIRAFAGKATKHDKLFLVPVELRGKRKDGREAIYSRGEIVLVASLPAAPPADRPPPVSPLRYPVTQVYSEHLFHGPELRGIDRVTGSSASAFIGTARPAPLPSEWFQAPLRSAWVGDPLVLDSSFQMMILWTLAQHATGSLPCFAGRYRQYRKSFPSDPTTVVIRVRRDDGKFARADIDYLDPEGRVIAQMQDYECVMDKNLTQAFRRNQLVKK